MRKIVLFATMALIAIIYGCNSGTIIDEEPKGKVITIAALLPDKFTATVQGAKTRLALEQEELNVKLAWQEGDKLDLLLVDGSKKTKRTATLSYISDAGKKAFFTVDLSEVVGNTFDLYGIYGGGGLSDSDPTKAALPTATTSAAGRPAENMMLTFAKTGINKANPNLPSITFEHAGSLFSIELKNIGTNALTGIKKARLVSTSSSPAGVYINSGAATYNVVTGDVEGATTATELTFEIPVATDLLVGESLGFLGWYIPNTNAWSGIKLELLDSSNKLLQTTANTKDVREQAVARGNAFYFRSFFNDAGLRLVDASNIQSAVDLAIWLSFPLYGDGTAAHPDSFVKGTIGTDVEQASPEYKQARLDAYAIAKAAGNPLLPQVNMNRRYAHCSQFTQTVIVNTIDPLFAEDTRTQIDYMNDAANGWVKIGPSENYTPSEYKPGDIFLTRVPDHTFMWIGEYGGHPDVVSDASVSGRLPGLRKSYINPTTGLDSHGRPYDVWRFVGRDNIAQ